MSRWSMPQPRFSKECQVKIVPTHIYQTYFVGECVFLRFSKWIQPGQPVDLLKSVQIE